jgi:hypothetical protein
MIPFPPCDFEPKICVNAPELTGRGLAGEWLGKLKALVNIENKNRPMSLRRTLGRYRRRMRSHKLGSAAAFSLRRAPKWARH